jgi:3-carboxy-cis,cis-muconate cycloisomerase
MSPLRSMFSGGRLASLIDDHSLLAAMLRFEAGLAIAQAGCGVIDASAARVIAAVCERLAAQPQALDDALDTGSLGEAARHAGTLAIPFVARLTRAVAGEDARAAGFVHLGATSQDVVDTATMLQARAAAAALDDELLQLGDALAALAQAHRATPITGRTLLQAAVPVSFGWKAAGWLDQLSRARSLLARTVDEQAVLQFGGAAGTLASLGDAAPRVARALASELSLPLPATSWHSARDRIARIGTELAMTTGACARIGRDVSLMMQTEVGEVFEPAAEGRGGSSAMPHKRNPVGSMLALEAALRTPSLAATLMGSLVSEHERGLGSWQHAAFVLADLFAAAASAAGAMLEVVRGLRVDTRAMHDNLARGAGFVHAEKISHALSASLGREAAQARVAQACQRAARDGIALRQALAADPVVGQTLDAARLDSLFDPSENLQAAAMMLDAVLAQWQASRLERRPGG